jgi:hypothetical protein
MMRRRRQHCGIALHAEFVHQRGANPFTFGSEGARDAGNHAGQRRYEKGKSSHTFALNSVAFPP